MYILFHYSGIGRKLLDSNYDFNEDKKQQLVLIDLVHLISDFINLPAKLFALFKYRLPIPQFSGSYCISGQHIQLK